jgi:hypothetical protein
MKNTEFDYVAIGNVKHGEYMRRYQAEAEEIAYRELTDEEAESVKEQEGTYNYYESR